MVPNTTDKLLRDIIDIPAQVRAGDLLVDLAKGFDTSADLIKKYVVTPQLSDRLNEALGMDGTRCGRTSRSPPIFMVRSGRARAIS
ncbi:hypothetical protein [Salinispora arenicola]|uniref:hypothetical protein n=1 Tax=Salinispora arenicola TaxID=168697 RepID=UPI0027DB14E0|nr:hypothetical protein [Salinispora arenicola]